MGELALVTAPRSGARAIFVRAPDRKHVSADLIEWTWTLDHGDERYELALTEADADDVAVLSVQTPSGPGVLNLDPVLLKPLAQMLFSAHENWQESQQARADPAGCRCSAYLGPHQRGSDEARCIHPPCCWGGRQPGGHVQGCGSAAVPVAEIRSQP